MKWSEVWWNECISHFADLLALLWRAGIAVGDNLAVQARWKIYIRS